MNQLLGLEKPQECALLRRREERAHMGAIEWEVILLDFCHEGAKLLMFGEGMLSRRLIKQDMKPVPRAWSSFIIQTLRPS